MFVIGIDIGTSGVKSTLLDTAGNALKSAYLEYDMITTGDGIYELEPSIILNNTFEVILRSTENEDRKKVRAICVTSFGEAFVCLDKGDKVITNAIVYMDKRGKAECDQFAEQETVHKIYSTTGQAADPMFSLYKLRWLKNNLPEVMEKLDKIFFFADYITYSLGADYCCDYSLAARSAMFDIKTKLWWKDAMDFGGVSADNLPKPVPGGSQVGTLSRSVAEKLGMNTDVKLILGSQDQIMAAIGGGAHNSGDSVNGMGTVDCITAIYDEQLLNFDAMMKHNLPIVPFLGDGHYATYAFNMSGGVILKWFRDTLAVDIAKDPHAYRILDESGSDSPTDIYVIPYFTSGGTPYMEAELPAVIAGLRMKHTRSELYRGFLEGETYEMRLNLDSLEESGIFPKEIVTVGGGSNSPYWMQIRSDIFNKEIITTENSQAGILGSAMLCYTNLGLYGSIQECQKEMIKPKAVFTPDTKNVEIYKENYKKYVAIYHAMKGVYK